MSSLSRSRRQFFKFLAASPLFQRAWSQSDPPVIAHAKDALSIMDFEAAAHKVMQPAHWWHMMSGCDDDATVRANREAFNHFQLRPRRMVDVSQSNIKTELFGTALDTPIFLSPIGSQLTYNPQGELAVTKAAKAKNAAYFLPNGSSKTIEEVIQASGMVPWFQLYMPKKWEEVIPVVRRVEATGCKVLTWTIDELAGRNLESDLRYRYLDKSNCAQCHTEGFRNQVPNGRIQHMEDGYKSGTNPPFATWEWVDRLRKLTTMKITLKGIVTAEDAKLCREHGVDGIFVSNHGGRSNETRWATIDSLGEVVDAAGGMPVLVDGGFRRGTDVYKALALGARAVGIGRPYVWGLAAFGQEGVEQVLDVLTKETQLIMRQCGTPNLTQITRAYIRRAEFGN
jgi:isopentenyl diphosphate isomerase/L-lactate dehydrogenase-like FMN-dependent dehydrogenase